MVRWAALIGGALLSTPLTKVRVTPSDGMKHVSVHSYGVLFASMQSRRYSRLATEGEAASSTIETLEMFLMTPATMRPSTERRVSVISIASLERMPSALKC